MSLHGVVCVASPALCAGMTHVNFDEQRHKFTAPEPQCDDVNVEQTSIEPKNLLASWRRTLVQTRSIKCVCVSHTDAVCDALFSMMCAR